MHVSDEVLLATPEDQACEQLGQINVPPAREGALWKVITSALRCPRCASMDTKAHTGKRVNGQGFVEQYRHCTDCELRFRVILE